MKKLVFFWLTATLFLLLSTPGIAVEANASDEARQVPVRVMTYNMHTGIGSDGSYDLDRIANTIQASDADVIGLQEVDVHWAARSNFDDQLTELAETLNMHSFFAPIYDQDPLTKDEPRRQFGVAVLSKFPITSATNREITRLSTQDANPEPALAPGFADVRINAKGAHFSFFVTHLDYRADPFVRELQVDDMLRIIPETGSSVLVGDMNAGPSDPELQPLLNRFQDAWNGAGDGNTYPAASPQKRIDFILASQNVKLLHTEVIQTDASDHLPVVSDLLLTRGN
ncbi:endonuclease/exonuclease/phosphatase family protein [Sediminibacillus halophilus]|uniref:Metal-dependent hydrolase, endonuclease/exonuclease/phosphatase family n=1 Tax=Sediminibacillus halophilus TaxID=482461 RepID=A0A1G9RZP1_9BACI|nr:endonuclease/exonuclease/phosphatase family protein [Sediminibacillus halophilus]SDM28686.1 Metal-dependent hydrolase, endonuclease/exonuclease/phosphatase family [Sediminibacillus halophilus]